MKDPGLADARMPALLAGSSLDPARLGSDGLINTELLPTSQEALLILTADFYHSGLPEFLPRRAASLCSIPNNGEY